MNTHTRRGQNISKRAILLAAGMILITAASTRLGADTGTCGGQMITLPFTDVPSSNIFFCSIAEAFFSGLTNGSTPTTYSPSDPVPREQMSAFITRTMDQSLRRGSKRAALREFWTTQGAATLGLTTVGTNPSAVAADGSDVWVVNFLANSVSRVRGSDGKLLDTWTGADGASGVLCAMGKVFVAGGDPGKLYQIDPTQTAGVVTTLSSSLGTFPHGMAFDGQRIWTSNIGSVSIVNLSPFNVMTVTAGFGPCGDIIFDGANIWVSDAGDNKIKKLDSNGNIVGSVSVGVGPFLLTFDGTNIWVPNQTGNSVSVVRAIGQFSGTVLATLTGNGLDGPSGAAFDGERILITNQNGNSVSLWKASDLTPIGTFSTGMGTIPFGVCSDGVNFWIALPGTNKLARF